MAKRAKKSKAQEQKELGEKMAARNAQVEQTSTSDPLDTATELPAGQPAPAQAESEVTEHSVYADSMAEPAVGNESDGEPAVGNESDGEPAPNSVVAAKYKTKYIENARAAGHSGKAARRSNWDWLSQQIASQCLNTKHNINMQDFLALLDANGVDHSKWTNRSKGWEGRLRMTGRVALQKVVANSGVLHLIGGSELQAPAEWAEKYKDKDKAAA